MWNTALACDAAGKRHLKEEDKKHYRQNARKSAKPRKVEEVQKRQRHIVVRIIIG